MHHCYLRSEVVYAPFGEEGTTTLLHRSFEKDVTTVRGKEVSLTAAVEDFFSSIFKSF